MAGILQALHDEIDDSEEALDQVRAILRRYRDDVLPQLLAEQFAKNGDPMDALEELAAMIADELAPITTARVRAGFDAAKRR